MADERAEREEKELDDKIIYPLLCYSRSNEGSV